MIFSSLFFLFRFLPVFLMIYFLTPRRARNFALFLGSLVFYAWGEPVYVLLMLFSTVSDYMHGLAIEGALAKGRQRRAKVFLISSVLINLLMLGFFKYADFVIGILNGLGSAAASLLGIRFTELGLLSLPLPIGISFYTFQTMSYTIDIYRKKVPAQKNIISFGAYVTMFPQLVAGPIVKYKDAQKELDERCVTAEGIRTGTRRFLIGLGKKVLLANQAGELYARISGWEISELTVAAAWYMVFLFAFQIYFDFSGYSDMAVGLGRMMGFTFPENFNYPYISCSVTEFWRRWHMSLSGWFKEYVYIPMGGNRRGLKRQIFNIFVVWLLTGIWHGASWNFLFWGLWFGVFLIAEKTVLWKWLQKLPRAMGLLYTWLVVLGGWVLFESTVPGRMPAWIAAMLGGNGAGFANSAILYEISGNAALFLLLAAGCTPLPAKLGRKLCSGRIGGTALECVFLLAVFLLSVAFLVDASYNPFLYFRF